MAYTLKEWESGGCVVAPVEAMWPRLTPVERRLVTHVVRCQLRAFKVRVPMSLEMYRELVEVEG